MFLESLESKDEQILLQRHLSKNKESRREHIRVWVVGAETAEPKFSAVKYISESKGDPRSNWSINKKAERYTLNPSEKDICISAAQSIGAGVAALDLMYDDDNKLFIVENNTNPGLGIRSYVSESDDPVRLVVKYVIAEYNRSANPNQKFWDNIAVNAFESGFNVNLFNSLMNIGMREHRFKLDVAKAVQNWLDVWKFTHNISR